MRKKGFTLIELLVVISIIALLLSILMPGLQKAKAAAKNVVCRSNQKQMATAFHTYYLEYNNKALSGEGAQDFWFLQIGPYLGDGAFSAQDLEDGKDPETTMKSSMQTVKCPATKSPLKEWDASKTLAQNGSWGTAKNQYRYHAVRVEGSYTINRWVGGWNYQMTPDTKIGQKNLSKSYRNSAPGRSNIPLLADGIWVDTLPGTDNNPVPEDLDLGDTTGSEGLGRLCTNRHGLDTNVAYCDGHVEKIKLSELWMQRWSKEFIVDRDVQVPMLDR